MTRPARSFNPLEKEILDVTECEQRRLGRDLHDGVCQELAGLALLIHAMQHRMEEGGRISAGEVTELRTLARTALQHARGIARGLDPVAAEPHGLSVALRQLAADTTTASQVLCTFYHPRPVEVANSLAATHLYRIAQDAVRDAVRDGGARRISIELRGNPDGIELIIGDDGTDGISRPCTLRMMKHRARVIAATLKVYKGARRARVVCRLFEDTPPRTRGCHENDQPRRCQARPETGGDGQTPGIPGGRPRHRSPRPRRTD